MTSKTYFGGIYCTINGEKYEFYKAGDFVILEITDQTRAFNSGLVIIEDYDDRYLVEIEWVSRKGEKPTKGKLIIYLRDSVLQRKQPYLFILKFHIKLKCLKTLANWISIEPGDYTSNPTTYPKAMDFMWVNDPTISPKLLLKEKGILKKMQEIACTT